MLKKSLALSAVAVAALSGCTSSHKSSSPTTPSTTVSAPASTGTVSPGTTAAATTSVPAAAAPSTTVASGPQPCPTASLSASLGSPNGAAGTVYYDLTFTNDGSVACTLLGYPGVSFVTGSSGTQVGAAAVRSNGSAVKLTLNPGQAAAAPLGITEASNYGANCQITNVTGLRVYPPGQTAALFVPHTGQGCNNPADVVLHVGPLAA